MGALLTVVNLLLLAAFIVTIGAAANRAPLWAAVLLLVIAVALAVARVPLK